MLNKHVNSKKQGDAGVGAAIGYFTSHGYCVNIPLTDSQEYDLVVDINGVLLKVQVKTSTQLSPSGNYMAQLSVKGGNKSGSSVKKFDGTAVDYLFILTPIQMYFIPTKDLANANKITLGMKYDQYIV